MRAPDLSVSRRVASLIDASPTPYHAVATAAAALDAAGFREIAPGDALPARGSHYTRRGGALVAWSVGEHHAAASPVRIVGAHTDSPNLRIKPQPDTGTAGWRQLGVEIYGGVLLNSWLDRDLGLAGRIAVRDGNGTTTRLVRDDRPLLRVPQLAIHLDRDIREKGLLLNPQHHMAPVWATGDAPTFAAYLATLADVDEADVVAWDMMAHDVTPAALTGLDEQFLASARIDNLLSCFVGLDALVAAAADAGESIPMLCLFDHEEVGSVSSSGAASPLLSDVLDRIGAALGGDLESRATSRAASLVVSADGAHATHPNFADRHEPDHRVAVNAGPVLKINANQRYATDAESAAAFTLACERAEVPLQRFVTRTDLACGSTIGPVSAGQLGIAVVDAGCAQLAMHAAREMSGSHDPGWFLAALTELLSA
ncbi:MAG: M18 family aminopeptidase [Acidimicrobiales bacterium]|nr:M18 family aminopeptidase [Acidimicrobiales bacterium]